MAQEVDFSGMHEIEQVSPEHTTLYPRYHVRCKNCGKEWALNPEKWFTRGSVTTCWYSAEKGMFEVSHEVCPKGTRQLPVVA